MSLSGHNGHHLSDKGLDDATVEALLAGRYQGVERDLLEISKVLEQLRSFAAEPAPPPSRRLAHVLGGSAPSLNGHRQTSSGFRDLLAWKVRRRVMSAERVAPVSHAFRMISLPTVAASVVVVLVGLAAAGSARLLPGTAQDVMARIVRTVTPFDLPEAREPEAVLAKPPSGEAAPPSTNSAPVDAAPPLTAAVEANGGQSGARGDNGSRPPTSPTTRPAEPAATSPALPVPAVTETSRPPGGVGGPAPSRVAKGQALTARLRGATGDQGAGDADGEGTAILEANPGRDELCLTLEVSGTGRVTSAHVHATSAGMGARVVALFAEPAPGSGRQCVTVPDEVIKGIRKEPGNYHVDVHTTEFPNGAIRGQLTK